MVPLTKAQTWSLVGRVMEGAGALGHRLGTDQARDALLLRYAMSAQPWDASAMEAVQVGAAAEFPVKPADLMPDLSGRALGQRLSHLRAKWIASGFTLSREDLLQLP